jgi:hypothetical protein
MQPHTPAWFTERQALPAGLATQLAQIAPPSAHWSDVVPATHFFCALSQQPPLQGEPVPHDTPHAPAVQACRSGHAAQAPPVEPHLEASVPATHVAPSQQPPLQGWFASHAVTHRRCPTSHASPLGQSALCAQLVGAKSPDPSVPVGASGGAASADPASGGGACAVVPHPLSASTSHRPVAGSRNPIVPPLGLSDRS